jgi:hypothetical protein
MQDGKFSLMWCQHIWGLTASSHTVAWTHLLEPCTGAWGPGPRRTGWGRRAICAWSDALVRWMDPQNCWGAGWTPVRAPAGWGQPAQEGKEHRRLVILTHTAQSTAPAARGQQGHLAKIWFSMSGLLSLQIAQIYPSLRVSFCLTLKDPTEHWFWEIFEGAKREGVQRYLSTPIFQVCFQKRWVSLS